MKRPILRRLTLLLMFVLAACSSPDTSSVIENQAASGKSPYIVVLKEASVSKGVMSAKTSKLRLAKNIAAKVGAEVETDFDIIDGFVTDPITAAAAQELIQDPSVAYVELDRVITGGQFRNALTWGQDRINQDDLPLDAIADFGLTGRGVNMYVIDSGIRATHEDFRGRVGIGTDIVDNDSDPTDCHGHGTHVAGTVGGANLGVAKAVTLHAVRVLDCNNRGFTSEFIEGLEWVRDNRAENAIANMSIQSDTLSRSLNAAADSLVDSGVTVVTIAANFNSDTCTTTSPGSADKVITVAASDIDDRKASFSGWGPCVDLSAPGVGIISASHTSDTETRSFNGTSMSAPHVAGVAAMFLELYPGSTPQEIKAYILAEATVGRLQGLREGTPNLLLHTPRPTTGKVGFVR